MAPSGKLAEHPFGILFIPGLSEDLPVKQYHCVRTYDRKLSISVSVIDLLGLYG